MRRKLRWTLSSHEGEQIRSGLSFGSFDDEQAVRRALTAASPSTGDTLDVYLDGVCVCSMRAPGDVHTESLTH